MQDATKTVSIRLKPEDYARVYNLAGRRGLNSYCKTAVLAVTNQLESTLKETVK